MHGPSQRDSRGLTIEFRPMPSCVIKLMTVFSVHSVLENQQQQLDLPQSQLSSPRQGPCVVPYGPSGRAAWTAHHKTRRRASMLGHLSSLRSHGTSRGFKTLTQFMKVLIRHNCSLLTTDNVWANYEIYRDTLREVM
jgi:hypothetical protein